MIAKQRGFWRDRSCLNNLISFPDKVTVRVDRGEGLEVYYIYIYI